MIKEVKEKDLKEALALVNEVFEAFVAVDYGEEGRNTFSNHIKNKYDEYHSDLLAGNKKMWAYYEDGKIVGVIATRDVSHISLLFVHKDHHKKGIARQMFNRVLEELKEKKEIREITVNSSPYAVNVYEKLGFIKTGEEQEKDGIIFVPMKQEISFK